MLDEDEADIEADIQRELDALGNDCLQIEDLEDETSTTPRANEVFSARAFRYQTIETLVK